ncbi:MAG: choline/carnitine O-acyltransferase [Bdellovibrionia bacterium]
MREQIKNKIEASTTTNTSGGASKTIEALPQRPIPDLSHTLRELSKSADPFLTPMQKISHRLFSSVTKAVLEPSQTVLRGNCEDWADRAMQQYYLTNRKSLAFYSNVFYLMEDDPTCSVGLDRASAIIRAALEFYQSLKDGTLAPDVFKGTSWGTDPYHPLFSTSRLPQPNKDQIISWSEKRHVIIAYQGSFYPVSFFQGGETIEISSFSEIRETLRKITEKPAGKQKSENAGVFTTLPRELWAKNREELLQDPTNRKTLETIESAILFIALDFESFPKDRTESIWMLAHNHPENRWYDKSHQLIISGNGKAGLNRDHTAVDGNPTSRYISEVCLRAQEVLQNSYIHPDQILTQKPKKSSKVPDQDPINDLQHQKLLWTLTPAHKSALQTAFKESDLECQNRELLIFDFPDFGENFFRLHQVSSDTAIQLVIQLAAYKCMGKLMSVNEAVNMRHFQKGRYDTIFCMTEESKNFLKATQAGPDLKQLKTLFLQAVQAHKSLVKNCKVGNSPYLHLGALMGLQADNNILKLGESGIEFCSWVHWNDFGFSKIMNSDVTTSNPGIKPGMEILGFTDTAPNVIGIAYLVDINRVRIFIKTDHLYFGKAGEMQNQMISGLMLLQRILGSEKEVKPNPLRAHT